MTLTSQQLIDLMARVPVEVRPSSIERLLDIMSVREIEQMCIGSLVQWLDAWCEERFPYYRSEAVKDGVYVARILEAQEAIEIESTTGPTRTESLVALVEQLLKQEAGR